MSFRRTVLPLTLLIALALPQSGCIGSFRLTNAVYDFNRGLGSLVVQEIVFLAFLILPVYNIAILVDAIILNVIEAFTGSNPMGKNAGDAEVVALADDTSLSVLRTADGVHTVLALPGQDPMVRTFRFAKDRLDVQDGDGVLLARAEWDRHGGVVVTDGGGRMIRDYSPAEVDRAVAAWREGGAGALAAYARDASAQAVVDAE